MNENVKDVPIIKLFVHEGEQYLYEPYSNRLLKISRKLFKELKEVQKIGITEYMDQKKQSQEYKDAIMLIRKKIIRKPFVKKIIHPETEYIESYLQRSISDLCIQVTQDCNFSCRYCLYANDTKVERNHEKINMKWEVAKKSIDFLYVHSYDSKKISISFYGGEPLLNFDLISKIVEYIEKKFYSKKIEYRMTINGSILTNDMLDFFIEHNFYISISLDGPEFIQNSHRKFGVTGGDTYDTVYNNVKKIIIKNNDYFNKNVSFLPVLFEDEEYSVIENFFDSELGVQNNQLIPLKANLSGMDYIFSNVGLHKVKRKNFNYKYSVNVDSEEEKRINSIYKNKNTIPEEWHHNGQCIPGVQRVFVDINGVFYPCEKITEDLTYAIGDVDNGFNVEKIKEILNIGKLTENDCKNCWAMRFCECCVSLCNDIDKKKITCSQKKHACNYQKEKAIWFLKNYINKSNLNEVKQ